MEKIYSIEEVKKIIDYNEFVFLYISGPKCSVCTALKPKINDVLNKYERIKSIEMNISDNEHISGEFSVFTIPAIIGYFKGKEILREARFISVLELDKKLNRYYDFL